MKFSVLGFLPANTKEITQAFCKRCVKTYSYKEWLDHEEDDRPLKDSEESKGNNKYKCFQCAAPTVPIYMMQFLVKDEQTMGCEKIYKIFFYTYACNGT